MLRLSMPCFLSSRISAVLLLATPLAASSSDEPSAWDQVALGLLREANEAFAEQPEGDRKARFGEAITLINLQPKTDANLERAAALLTGVVSSGADDMFGVAARYYLARIAQFHRSSPDTREALRLYHELAALNSTHLLAQRAMVQIAIIELFEPGVAPEEIRARYERLSGRGTSLTEASAIRDFNLVLAEAALRFKLGNSLALDHLIAADKAGLARPVTERDTWVRIAELARETGRNDVAIAYYRRFLTTFRRDSRNVMITERLNALLAGKKEDAP
jgi:hypothetical protein